MMSAGTLAGVAGRLIEYAGLAVVLAGLIVFFGLKTSHFFDRETFVTIANEIPASVLVVVGMTFVLIGGGIDLSVGSVLGLSGRGAGAAMVPRPPAAAAGAAAACLGVGAGLRPANGLVRRRFDCPRSS